MKILARGKIEIKDCWAKLAVRVDKKLTGREDITYDCDAIQKAEWKAEGCVSKVGELCLKNEAAGINSLLGEIQKVDPNYKQPDYPVYEVRATGVLANSNDESSYSVFMDIETVVLLTHN